MKNILIPSDSKICKEIARKVQEKLSFQTYIFETNENNKISEIMKSIENIPYDTIIEIRENLNTDFSNDFMICCSSRAGITDLMSAIVENLSEDIKKTKYLFYFLENKPNASFRRKTKNSDSRTTSFYSSIFYQEYNNTPQRESIIVSIGNNNLNNINIIEEISYAIASALLQKENKNKKEEEQISFLKIDRNNNLKPIIDSLLKESKEKEKLHDFDSL